MLCWNHYSADPVATSIRLSLIARKYNTAMHLFIYWSKKRKQKKHWKKSFLQPELSDSFGTMFFFQDRYFWHDASRPSTKLRWTAGTEHVPGRVPPHPHPPTAPPLRPSTHPSVPIVSSEAIPPLVYLSERFTVSSVTGSVKSSMGVGGGGGGGGVLVGGGGASPFG